MIEDASELIPHKRRECIELFGSIDFDMCDILGGRRDIEIFGFGKSEGRHFDCFNRTASEFGCVFL